MIVALPSNKFTQAISTPKPNITQVLPESSPLSGPQPINDKVNISDEGKYSLISSKLHSIGKGSASAGSINDDFRNAISYAEDKIQTIYHDLGISADSQMNISVGYDGHILVNGENPKAEALAEAINADDALANTIRGMSAMASLLEAIKKAQEFRTAYEKDPTAAIERYGYLLEDGHDYHVSFSMNNGHINTKVQYI